MVRRPNAVYIELRMKEVTEYPENEQLSNAGVLNR